MNPILLLVRRAPVRVLAIAAFALVLGLSACGDGGGECAPACEEGDEVVASSSDCLQDDAACYEVSACGTTIWCTGPRPCTAPPCW